MKIIFAMHFGSQARWISISHCKTTSQLSVNNNMNDYFNLRRRPSVKIVSVWREIKRVLYFILYHLHHRSFHQIPWQEIRNDRIRIIVFAFELFKLQINLQLVHLSAVLTKIFELDNNSILILLYLPRYFFLIIVK